MKDKGQWGRYMDQVVRLKHTALAMHLKIVSWIVQITRLKSALSH